MREKTSLESEARLTAAEAARYSGFRTGSGLRGGRKLNCVRSGHVTDDPRGGPHGSIP
jgi:hypothetical protein